MSDKEMPATEAETVVDTETIHYELAFHVLPTVAEGEVADAQSAIRDSITKFGGTIDTEEAASSYDLAYDIKKNIDGKNRTFSTSHFGWIRFMGTAEMLGDLKEELDHNATILRYMIVKLTKEEAANPFKVFELKVKTSVMDEDAEVIETKTENEEEAPVEAEKLDESLEKITTEEEK
jgi:ribosomal protein S6